MNEPESKGVYDIQISGNHYKTMKIQPIEFIQANDLGFEAGNVVKYVCRHKMKNGIEDLEKAIHYIQLLIEKEKKRLAEINANAPEWLKAKPLPIHTTGTIKWLPIKPLDFALNNEVFGPYKKYADVIHDEETKR